MVPARIEMAKVKLMIEKTSQNVRTAEQPLAIPDKGNRYEFGFAQRFIFLRGVESRSVDQRR